MTALHADWGEQAFVELVRSQTCEQQRAAAIKQHTESQG